MPGTGRKQEPVKKAVKKAMPKKTTKKAMPKKRGGFGG